MQGVFKQLTEIASIEGHKSQDQKKSLIMKLLSAAKDAEPGFIVRSMQGKLRIGLAEQSVLVALAQAVTLEVRSAVPGALNSSVIPHCIVGPPLPDAGS